MTVVSLIDLTVEPEHTGAPVPAFQHIQDMDVNVHTREIFVCGDIEDDFGGWFTCAIRYLEAKAPDPITVWISTPGGDVTSMFTFHDLVQTSKCQIITIGSGQVCSAGVLMLACGHHRLVTDSCVLMSHRSDATLSGSLEAIDAQRAVLKWGEQRWASLMDAYTPAEVDGKARDQKYWFNLGKKETEWWIMGGQAILNEGISDALYSHDTLEKLRTGDIGGGWTAGRL